MEARTIHIPENIYRQLEHAASIEQRSIDDEAAAILMRNLPMDAKNSVEFLARIQERRKRLGGYLTDEWLEDAINFGRT